MASMDTFFKTIPHQSLFSACIYPWEALDQLSGYLESLSLGKIACEIPEGAFLVRPELISIGEGTVVEPGAYIEGPCVIGKNCQVRHGAYVRSYVLTGNGCVIGHASEIKGSILFDGAAAAHFNYVGDSILGNGVNLGAGAKLANMRLDRDEVVVSLDGEKLATGRSKLGAIIGDRSQVGCNVVLSPGTLLKPGAMCIPPRFQTFMKDKVICHDNANSC